MANDSLTIFSWLDVLRDDYLLFPINFNTHTHQKMNKKKYFKLTITHKTFHFQNKTNH